MFSEYCGVVLEYKYDVLGIVFMGKSRIISIVRKKADFFKNKELDYANC